ncbi:MAG TPA: hypothetical protein VGR74_09615 [Actinomycetota bacterium]|nr:hypothetical protein [Actinomycetota bacterium]
MRRTDMRRWGMARAGGFAPEQQEGDPMQLKELAAWWQQRRLAREARAAFDSAATRELYEALDEASMLAPRR